MPARIVSTALAVLLLWSGTARADLRDDAARLERTWTRRGARVVRLPPRFLEHGHLAAIGVPMEASGDSGCAALVLLGARGSDFSVFGRERLLDPRWAEERERTEVEPRGAEEERFRSAAGALMLSRCGAARAELRKLVVEMRSPRAVLEMMVVRSPGAIADLEEVLPERASGPLAPRGDPGRPVEPAGTVAERLARAERRARADGAERIARAAARSSADGQGSLSLQMEEGCHRVEVMAEVPSTLPRRATDIDVEARDSEGGRVLGRDRSEAPDGRLDFCLGGPTSVDLSFVGASGSVSVTAQSATWSIPRGVPARWGTRARGALAGALRRRRAPAVVERPTFETLGVQGSTAVAVQLEPGRCYLAAIGLVRGESRGIRLSGRIGERNPRDEVVERAEGASLAFCSEDEESITFEVEMRGASPWWVMALWPVGEASP